VLNYDAAQRAYIVPATLSAPLQLTLEGSPEHSIYHPAFVLEGWTREAKVNVLRGATTEGLIRQGVIEDLSIKRVVIYLPIVAEGLVEITIDK
jgi:hypothetical protein